MANGRDNVSETFKLQILEAISTIRKNRNRPDGKTIQEYINHSSAGNINESFVLDNLRVLVDQNIILNKPTSSGDSYYIVESNSSDKCIIPIDCDTPLNVVHKNMQGDNGKNRNNAYPKNITVIQDTSTNTSNRVTVTQDASTSASNRVAKGTDSYLDLVLKSLRDHIVSLENQLRDKQYIIEELLKKSYQSSCNCTVANSNLINAQKYHTKYTQNPMIPSSNVNDCKFC